MTHSGTSHPLPEAGWSRQSPLDPQRLCPHQHPPPPPPSPKGPQSCENSMPLTLTSSSPETRSVTTGMWAGARLWAAGQPRGQHNGESRPGKGDASVSTPPPSTAALAEDPAAATFTGCRRGAGHRGCVGRKGPWTPSPGEQRGLGEEQGAQRLRRPLYKQPAQPRHTSSPPHRTSLIRGL